MLDKNITFLYLSKGHLKFSKAGDALNQIEKKAEQKDHIVLAI